MTETTRQIIFVVSLMVLMAAITSIAAAANEAKGVPGLKALSVIVALGMSALCLHSLVTDPRSGISFDNACIVVGGTNAIALLVVMLVSRRRTPAVN